VEALTLGTMKYWNIENVENPNQIKLLFDFLGLPWAFALRVQPNTAVKRSRISCLHSKDWKSTSFPGLQCEDEARHEEALVWAGQFCILIGTILSKNNWTWQLTITIQHLYFMILVCTSMFCKIIFQSKTFFRLHDLLSPRPVSKLKSRVDVSCDVSWQNKKRLLLIFKL
jgi:hypothetical protein